MEKSENVIAFEEWLSRSQPNNRYVYYVGATLTENILVSQLRKATWRAAVDGKVYLFRRRNKEDDYDYIAIRAAPTPIKWLIPSDEPIHANQQTKSPGYYYNPRKPSLMERVA